MHNKVFNRSERRDETRPGVSWLGRVGEGNASSGWRASRAARGTGWGCLRGGNPEGLEGLEVCRLLSVGGSTQGFITYVHVFLACLKYFVL